ncbi:hypothetical protein N0V93_001583 [Gnomoniopsis smithogilvyi]|uniref:Protein rds1 n=1 Tax=Gnomoniopsis smithogilvyi TaxID=1191159 RepID=A0A9W8Z476_9PEZI|nr:hypothetical protein N0V93_001583 [Gnomoniopsis smithogilvyi]
MSRIIAVGGFLALAQSALAAPLEERFVSDATTTITSAASVTVPVVPVTDVTSHGPYTGPSPTTTGALSTSVLAASIPALPAESSKFDYPADGLLHANQPAPYTPAGGQGTNGSAPVYRVQSDFDYQSISVGLYQEWIELDLFHYGLATYSVEDFEAAGLTAEDRFLLQFMAEQEVGHATLLTNMLGPNAPKQCTYNYPSMNVREYIDFSQKLTRWGESGVYGFLNHLDAREVGQLLLQSISTEARQQMIFRQFNGQFPMPVWFETGIPQSWAWTLLAPYISSCPEGTQQLIWQNFPALHILNQPNAARIDGADVYNDTLGDYANTLSTKDVSPDAACVNATTVGQNCAPAITHNRTEPLSYPGREVFLQWETPGQAIGPNNSYVTSTSASAPQFAMWVTQLNVTYSPLLNVSGNSAYTIQPNVSTYQGDPAINGTMFLAITDSDLYVTPFNLSQINPHVYALALYQAG